MLHCISHAVHIAICIVIACHFIHRSLCSISSCVQCCVVRDTPITATTGDLTPSGPHPTPLTFSTRTHQIDLVLHEGLGLTIGESWSKWSWVQLAG